MSQRDLIAIDMACNDPDNGLFIGRVAQIALRGEALDLTAKAWGILSHRGCPNLRVFDSAEDDAHHFVLSGKRWPFVRIESWVGNWCWNRFWLTSDVATLFLEWLHGRGLFRCEGGWVELSEAWDAPGPLVLPEKWWVA